MLDELKMAKKVVGIKQLRRALSSGNVKKVFLAEDADPNLVEPLIEECNIKGIQFEKLPTMKELGRNCGIDVGATAAGILR